MSRPSLRRTAALPLAAALAVAVGCSPQEPRGEPRAERAPETVEVEAPAFEALVVADEDYAAAAPTPEAPGVAGVLPRTFPSDLPLYAPSTVVDLHLEPDAPERVVFLTPDRPADVAAAYFATLRQAGWRLLSGEAELGEAGVWTKGGRRVELLLEDARPGTRIRVTYSR